MEKRNSLHLRLELLWWLVTALVVVGVLYPVCKVKADYPFWFINTIFIVSLITLGRYIFLLKHTFLAYRQWLKVAVAVLCIPLFLYLMKELNLFRALANEIGLEEMFNHLSLKGQTNMAKYVRREMLFFGTGSIIGAALMVVRMVVSFWRTHNRGTV